MNTNSQTKPFRSLVDDLKTGTINRRRFMERSAALGVSGVVATFVANATQAAASGDSLRNGFAFYQGADGTPSASPVDDAGNGIPRAGMDQVTRGAGGTLNILQWQAPTTAAHHTANGNKSVMVADMILEPLIRYGEANVLIPYLITEIPSADNGLLSEDFSHATFVIKEGILWSDGEPFTSEDVRFTWQWILTPSNGATSINVWSIIQDIEIVDDQTFTVHYTNPSPNWFEPFAGGSLAAIYPAHAFGGDIGNRNEAFDLAPIGTGPFKVDAFEPNDSITLSANENYWQENAPYYASIYIKGGGDAVNAARAVLQTGDYQFAGQLQIDLDALAAMLESAPYGHFVTVQGTLVETIFINFSDPETEVDGQRSEMNTPNPILTDPAIRQTINMAIDRDLVSRELYGDGQPATANVLTGNASFESPNTSWSYDLEKASQILDDAGWVLEDGVRTKDGVRAKIDLSTTVNAVRQKTQAIVQAGCKQLGIDVTINAIDAGIFFDSGTGNDQNTNHFYFHTAMMGIGPHSAIPVEHMVRWYAGEDRANIAQKSNNWQGKNISRYYNPDYDAVYNSTKSMLEIDEILDALIEMNDIVINEVVAIPIVNRAADQYAISNDLNNDNVRVVDLELPYWNIANWNNL
ncbi:MAG: peptide ABC transporter substrate-binding protein [Thermomicrobiales bacterium]|nr:peptide ABC transporter substrate-binding protein [Thermomicrobiales bacterium]